MRKKSESLHLRRTPRGYDGTHTTTRNVGMICADLLEKIGEKVEGRPDMILQAWPKIVGESFAGMSRAVSFLDGILHVVVNNSTLYSILSQYEKKRILALFRKKFPNSVINNITFRIG